MCGIFAIFNIKGTYTYVRTLAYNLSRRQRHRGPDRSGLVIIEVSKDLYHVLCHERLNIVDLSDRGRQPFQLVDDPKVYFMQNGETYNYWDLKDELSKKYKFQSDSDCEVVGPLYKEHGPHKLWENMDGMGASVVLDMNNNTYFAGRDYIGIISLYYGTKDGALFVASELKCIHDQVDNVAQLLPGHYIDNTHQLIKWYNPSWQNMDLIPKNPVDLNELREKLTNVVRREIKGDAPFGLFISGGVDSSVIAGIVAKLIKNGEIDLEARGMKKVHSFCVGLEGAPDLHYAKQVAVSLGFEHHSYTYTVDEGLDQIPEVIYHTETFNNTTIRASTPMYQMCRRIKALGIKICLTGEGADELFGGYLYFHKAPNGDEFQRELIRKLNDLYKYDLLRANKSCLAWGIEVRPPFMNRDWVEYVMAIDPVQKMPKTHNPPIEKYILRKAFDDPVNPYVPHDILWRQKEQFSDGVGYQWRDGIINRANEIVTDQQMQDASIKYPISTPMNKEQYWYRQVFESHFPSDAAVRTVPFAKSIACSTEKALEWDESFKNNTDESGRAVQNVHNSAQEFQDTLTKNKQGEVKHYHL